MNDKFTIYTNDYTEQKEVTETHFTNKALQLIEDKIFESEADKMQMLLQFRFRTKYQSETVFVGKDNQRGIRIDFNPNKIMNILPTQILTYPQLVESLKIVSDEVNSIGIGIDFNRQMIARHHTSFDLFPNKSYNAYRPMIKSIIPDTKVIKRGSKKLFEDTLYLENKSRTITVYDKTKESELNFNCIRFEDRFEKIPTKKRLLISDLNESLYYQKRHEAKQMISNSIFHVLNESTSNTALLAMELIAQGISTNDISKYISTQSINKDLEILELNSKQLFTAPSKINGIHNKTYSQMLRLRNMLNDYQLIPVEYIDKYYEIKNLFSKVA